LRYFDLLITEMFKTVGVAVKALAKKKHVIILLKAEKE
jgi:hypothetical protein